MCGEQNVWHKACFQKDDSSGFQWCICRWVSLLISNEFSSSGQPLRTLDHFFPQWTCMGWCSMCWILDFDVPSDPLWTSQSLFSWCSKYVFFHLEKVWCSKWLSATMCIYTHIMYTTIHWSWALSVANCQLPIVSCHVCWLEVAAAPPAPCIPWQVERILDYMPPWESFVNPKFGLYQECRHFFQAKKLQLFDGWACVYCGGMNITSS